MKEILSSSETINHEYCATVVRISGLEPIEGSDFLAKTLVNGLSIVVRKDLVKEGDIMFYAANETALNTEFLKVTNQFEMSHRELNANYEEVDNLMAQVETLRASERFEEADQLEAKAKSMVGFFNQHGRVKMIKLRGCPSMGYLFGVDAMAQYCPAIKDVNLEKWVDKDFDTVDGNLFIKVYVPPMRTQSQHGPGEGRAHKAGKKIARFDRMIPGEFAFHYDTQQLNRNMHRVNPDDMVTISVKIHGTSWIAGNILTKAPKWGGLYAKVFNKLPKFLKFTVNKYDNVYSSRTVIKNQYINSAVSSGFYKTDIWGEYNDLLKGIIPEGMTLYGEIFGYLTGTNSMIQKKYDYGCAEGTNKLMIYRITTKDEDTGMTREWNVNEVYDWTINLMKTHPEVASRIRPIDIIYHGTLRDFYPNISTEDHWHENVLDAMKEDQRFGMEKNEPFCKIKVPREGIVLRIDDDPLKEAFKLKCIKFLKHESDEIDNGTYEDIEVSERYDNGTDEN